MVISCRVKANPQWGRPVTKLTAKLVSMIRMHQKMVISVSFQKSIAFDWEIFGVEVREIGLAQREQLAQNLFSLLFLC